MPRYTVYKRVEAEAGDCRKCDFYTNNGCGKPYKKVVQKSGCCGYNFKKIKTYSAWRYIPKKYIKSK